MDSSNIAARHLPYDSAAHHTAAQHSTAQHSRRTPTALQQVAGLLTTALLSRILLHLAASLLQAINGDWLAGWLLAMAGQYSVPKIRRDSFGRLETSLCSDAKEMMYDINGMLQRQKRPTCLLVLPSFLDTCLLFILKTILYRSRALASSCFFFYPV